jgi:hypothetical protein
MTEEDLTPVTRYSTPGSGVPGRVGGGGGPRRVIGARGLAIVERMAREGHPLVSVAKALRMSAETLRLCRQRQPEVQEAWDRGRGALEVELTSLLLTKARGGDTIALLFALKCMCGWREGEPTEAARGGITIQLPSAMDGETYLAVISKQNPIAGAPSPALGADLLAGIEDGKNKC